MLNKSHLLAAVLFLTSAKADCNNTTLKAATDAYLAAQSTGKSDSLKYLLADNHTYNENDQAVNLGKGMLSQPLKIDHNISTHDPVLCATFTELIVTTGKQHVIGTRMVFDNNTSKITEIESVVTKPGDWMFNATGYLQYTQEENWEVMELDDPKWMPRSILRQQADTYFERLEIPGKPTPFGSPCARLEGGMYTGVGEKKLLNTCAQGMPKTPVVVTNRRYVIDEDLQAVSIFLGYPGLDRTQGEKAMPDSHFIRVEGGWLRYIHTLSVCVTPGCGVYSTSTISSNAFRNRQ